MREPSGWSWPCDWWIQPKFRDWTGFTKDPVLWLRRSTFPACMSSGVKGGTCGTVRGWGAPWLPPLLRIAIPKVSLWAGKQLKAMTVYPLSSICQFPPSTGLVPPLGPQLERWTHRKPFRLSISWKCSKLGQSDTFFNMFLKVTSIGSRNGSNVCSDWVITVTFV